MARTRRFIAVMALAAVPLAACADQDADRDDVIDSLTEAGASDEQAECAADGLTDELTQDELNKVADASDLDDLTKTIREKVAATMTPCFAGGEGGTPDTTADTSTTTTTEG